MYIGQIFISINLVTNTERTTWQKSLGQLVDLLRLLSLFALKLFVIKTGNYYYLLHGI